MGCSEFDGPIYHIIVYTGIGYKLYYMPLQRWSPQQHYVQVIVLASLGIFFSTSKCSRPRPDKGSLPVVCVQETKTLHAQHKHNEVYLCLS